MTDQHPPRPQQTKPSSIGQYHLAVDHHHIGAKSGYGQTNHDMSQGVTTQSEALLDENVVFQDSILVEKPGEVCVRWRDDRQDAELVSKRAQERQRHDQVADSGVGQEDDKRAWICLMRTNTESFHEWSIHCSG
jgi:hypothetical protein